MWFVKCDEEFNYADPTVFEFEVEEWWRQLFCGVGMMLLCQIRYLQKLTPAFDEASNMNT
jgi:hypothetical protein